MDIGATVQEIQNAKKQELPKQDFTRYDKKSSFKRDVKSTIYYYQNGDDSHIYRSFPEDIYVPIESYSDALIRKLDLYLNRIDRSLNVDTVNVVVTLRSVLYPNDKGFQLLHSIDSVAVLEMVQRYTRCIMQIVGSFAECVLVDNCANNSEMSRICMNIALFKNEILGTYDIPYDEYVAYSTSFAYMIYKDPVNGLMVERKNQYYNPHHTSMDISWCKKDNIWEQLRTEMREIRYVDNAKLHVKATLNCYNLDLEDYLLTQVIVFDYDHGFNRLKDRYPHHLIFSANNLFPEMALQMEK